ncbi:unnamed protein product [Adineta ricciae]|uniref:G-protein coupled receptors family 1 profile domain-containing protein n=1 Tax=Adineta ricciae TaxID=249248 RepID=A0A815PXM2_ADIRI|nr:unnamed protein product [Adineta ricciae]CAF1506899.1 unnamed protein product [Adineta ricciae]
METASGMLIESRDQSILDDYFYPSLAMKFYLWGYLSLFILGYTGNSASLLTFARPTLRASSTGILYMVLAISDICFLSSLTFDFIHYGLRLDLDIISDFIYTCRWREFLMGTSQFCSAWILVFIAMDRWIRTRFPYKSTAICTQKKALIVLAILLSTTIGLHAMFLTSLYQPFYLQIPLINCMPLRIAGDDFFNFYYETWPVVQLSISCLVPAGLILVFIVDMFIKIRLQKRIVHQHINNQNRNQTVRHNNRLQNQLFIIMLSNVIIFFITTVQIGIYRFLYWRTLSSSIGLDIRFFTNLTVILSWVLGINYSINFYVHCLTSTLFRREFKKYFSLISILYQRTQTHVNTIQPIILIRTNNNLRR